MSVVIGPTTVSRLVAARAEATLDAVDKVLQAWRTVVENLLETGARVKVLEAGYLVKIKTKATRRTNPAKPGELVNVPAGSKIVYRRVRGR